jgi:hypothetical protein
MSHPLRRLDASKKINVSMMIAERVSELPKFSGGGLQGGPLGGEVSTAFGPGTLVRRGASIRLVTSAESSVDLAARPLRTKCQYLACLPLLHYVP